MRVLELAEKMRAAGLVVIEEAGWQTRGNEFPARPRGALRHWTAAGPGVYPSGLVLIAGRADLPGPLCSVSQDRLDRIHIVASGKANHAGVGHWPKGSDIDSNYELLGLEIEWSGPAEPFPANRRDVSERVMAVLIDCCDGRDPEHASEHREYAEPAGRKIDTNLDGNVLRSSVRGVRAAAVAAALPAPAPTPAPTQEDDFVEPKIVWFKDPDPKSKEFHPYRIGRDDLQGVYIPGGAYDSTKNLYRLVNRREITEEGTDGGLGSEIRAQYALANGPCKNV